MNDDRAQWLKERRKGLGASDAAAALGLSKFRTPLKLFLDKTDEEAEPQEETEPMRFGNLLEPIVRSEFVRRTGLEVIWGQPPVVSEKYPWMRCNLDGWIPNGRRVFEAKTARTDIGWGEPGSDEIPQDYVLQGTHAMIVTGAEAMELAVLIGGCDFRMYTVELDRDLADLLIEGERAFWEAVQRREPPAPTSLAEINQRFRESRPVAVELSPAAAAACERLREIKEAEKTAQKEADACEFMVKEEIGEADTATINGQIAVTWKQAKASKVFDSKSFCNAHPEIAARFTTEIQGSRRFLLKAQR